MLSDAGDEYEAGSDDADGASACDSSSSEAGVMGRRPGGEQANVAR
jgi:hypothetical protein